MDIVKGYVSVYDYHNVILVNKEWYKIFKTIKEPVELYHLLNKGSWYNHFTYKIIINRELSILDLLKDFIDTIEPKTNEFEKKHIIYKPIGWHISRKIKKNPKLNCINLLGF